MNTKRKLSFGAFLSTFFIVLLFSISLNAVYAYFTATAERDLTFNFATLELSITDANTTLFTYSAEQDQDAILATLPGDTIDFTDIRVSNTGTADGYVLVNLNIQIAKTGQTTLSYNEWYNLSGTKVTTSFPSNTTAATLLQKSGSSTFNLEWVVPGDVVTNDYQGGTISATVTAYAVQAYLPDRPSSYSSDALYASYFIYTNHSSFTQS